MKRSNDIFAQFVAQHTPKILDLKKICFDKQLSFVTDPNPFVTAVCSRRAGKSTGCAGDLLFTAQSNPGTICLYLTLSRVQAKRIFWPIIKGLAETWGMGAQFNEVDLSIRLPNESIIYCLGAKDERAIDSYLGMPIIKVYIDEGQSFRSYLTDLIDRVLAPALLDYAGKIRLIGTPGCVPAGPFWELSQNQAWGHHHWTFWDNPHIATKSKHTHQELLTRELVRRGVTEFDPSIRRDYYGEWEVDSNSLVLQYSTLQNEFDRKSLPNKLNYVLGVDLGFHDADALAVLGWSDSSPITYLVDEKITSKQTISDLVAQIEQFRARYDISKITVDSGGLGKKIAEELLRRYKIPVEAADKTRKIENYSLLNDALRAGRFKAKESSRFTQDTFKVEWDWDKSTPERKVVSDRYHSDIIDAVLYAFKLSPAYAWEPPVAAPKQGSEAWAKAEEEDMFNQALERAQQDKEDASKDNENLWGSKKW